MKDIQKLAVGAGIVAISIAVIFYVLDAPQPPTVPVQRKSVVVVHGKNVPVRPLPIETGVVTPVASDQPVDPDARWKDRLASVSREVAPLVKRVPNVGNLYDKIRSEGRDDAWATRSEKLLHEQFAAVAQAQGSKQDFTVNCGVTLCEIYGVSGPDAALTDRANQVVQAPDFSMALDGKGYHDAGALFGPNADKKDVSLIYYRR